MYLIKCVHNGVTYTLDKNQEFMLATNSAMTFKTANAARGYYKAWGHKLIDQPGVIGSRSYVIVGPRGGWYSI